MIPLVVKRGVSFLSHFFHFSIFRIKVKAPHHCYMVGRLIVLRPQVAGAMCQITNEIQST